MSTWGELKTQIRRSILNDPEEQSREWADAQLLDMIGWALETFCAHTAMEATATFSPGAATDLFALPEDVYDEMETTGRLQYAADDKREWLTPVFISPGSTWSELTPDAYTTPRGYWEWPTGYLRLGFLAAAGSTLTLYYYAYWPKPTGDDSLLYVPRWAELALAYLVGAYAQHPLGVQASNIRQWGTKPDTGTPESNPLHRQTEHFLKLYDATLARHPIQNRFFPKTDFE